MLRRSCAWIVILLLSGCVSEETRSDPPAAVPAVLACQACGIVIDEVDGEFLWEPMVAVDPTDPDHVVASSQLQWRDPLTGDGRSWGRSHVSHDGGLTWESRDLPGGPRGDPNHPLADRTWMDDSVPAFLPDGTLLWSALVLTTAYRAGAGVQTAIDLIVFRSEDGLDFAEFVIVAEGEGFQTVGPDVLGDSVLLSTYGHDKQWLAVRDDGTAWLVWSENRQDGEGEGTLLRSSESSDGGRTWTQPTTVIEHVVSGAFPLFLPDGDRMVSYHRTFEQEAAVAHSTDGQSWHHEVIDTSTKFPMLASADGRVYLSYPRGDEGRDGGQDVALRWHDGVGWSDPIVIPTQAPGRTVPAVAAVAAGAYLTAWLPGPDDAQYVAYGVQAGTLTRPLHLGDHDGSTRITGDYMGLVPLPDGNAIAVWTSLEEATMRLNAARFGFAD